MTTEQAMIQSGEICCDCRAFIDDGTVPGKPRLCYACERLDRQLFGDREHKQPPRPHKPR